MPRNNRTTVKSHRRTQRSKVVRTLVMGDDVYIRTMNPRPDERGSATIKAVVNALLILAIITFGVFLTLAVFAPKADARAVQLDAAEFEPMSHNPTIWIEHVQGKWFYAELYDGSEWMVTRCRYEDSNNCYWNAKRRGNGKGRSFVVIDGYHHWVDFRMQP